MARKASSRQEEVREAVDSQPSQKAITKAAAVRRMLAEGIENPAIGSETIKDRFGIDVTPQQFSAARSQMKSREALKQGKPAKRGRKPKEASSQAIEGYLAPPPSTEAVDGRLELLAAMEMMKPLIASLGKEEAHRIVDLLG